jgi:hypothetical protein
MGQGKWPDFQFEVRLCEIRLFWPSVSCLVFLSDLRFQHHVPPALLPPGTKSWRVVELSLHVPWYIATVRDANEPCTRDLMLAYEADLVALIEASREAIQAIHRVVPAPAGGEWLIEQLESIWLITEAAIPNGRWWQFVGRRGSDIRWPRRPDKSTATEHRELVMSLGPQ